MLSGFVLSRSEDAVSKLWLEIKNLTLHPWINWQTTARAIKLSIAPTVLICAIQSPVWIHHFQTNAYLAPIEAVVVQPLLPRAKLLEYNLQFAISLAITYCWILLGGWCSIQARNNTHSGNDSYSASASAVAAIFLIFWIWCVFTIKSRFPSLVFQASAGVFAVAALPGVAQARTMNAVIGEVSLIFEAFLVGQAVGLVNALILFPETCSEDYRRDLWASFEATTSIMQNFQNVLHDFKRSCTSPSILEQSGLGAAPGRGADESNDFGSSVTSIRRLYQSVQQFTQSIVLARASAQCAEREIFWDQLDGSACSQLVALLADLVPPASALSVVANMLEGLLEAQYHPSMPEQRCPHPDEERIADQERSYCSPFPPKPESGHDHDTSSWHLIEERMHAQAVEHSSAIIEGAKHAKIRLGLESWKLHPVLGLRLQVVRTHNQEDTACDNAAGPGCEGFLDHYQSTECNPTSCSSGIATNEGDRETAWDLLSRWASRRPEVCDFSHVTTSAHAEMIRYFLLLHFVSLADYMRDRFLMVLKFVEEKHNLPERLMIPQFAQPRHWIRQLSEFRRGFYQGSDTTRHSRHKDPEHLPPSTQFQRLGNVIRSISLFLGSKDSAYGLRGVCAIMTIAIIAFLRTSHTFYFEQRFLWALFAILLSMGRTAGASTFLLSCRVAGTIASAIASYIIWYIVAKHTVGILVLLWMWFVLIGLFATNFPKLAPATVVAQVAAIVMTSNELQVRQIGNEEVIAQGEAVYPPFIIFPYRLAVVLLGVLTAYFWTIFPYPILETSQLRGDVAKAICKLANYNACMQQLTLGRLYGHSVDDQRNDQRQQTATTANADRTQRLHIMLRNNFRQHQSLLISARQSFDFIGWNFSFGGPFPKSIYNTILDIMQRLSNDMVAAGHVSSWLKPSSWWNDDHGQVVRLHLVPEQITTRLIILYSALDRPQPLPPGLQDLQIPDLTDYLSRRVPNEHGFAAAALLHSVNWVMIKDVNHLTTMVKQLVGEFESVPKAFSRDNREWQ